jgi:hypothetical protein
MQMGSEAKHSLQSTALFQNAGSYTTIPTYALMACTGSTFALHLLEKRGWMDLDDV